MSTTPPAARSASRGCSEASRPRSISSRSTTGRERASGGRRSPGSSRFSRSCWTPGSRPPSGGARGRPSERPAGSPASRRRWRARVPADLSAPRTVSFATLGCRLNQVDTQQRQTLHEARGFRTVDFDEPADVVVVNTCTVTARAELSDRQAIRRAARVSPEATLVVTGCWAQTSPGAVAGMEEVDLVVGNGDKHRLPDLLDRIDTERVHVSDIGEVRAVGVSPRGRLRARAPAVLKIQ